MPATPLKESTIFKFLIVFLIFMVVNFDPDMAIVFSLMIIADIIIWFDEKTFAKVNYPYESRTDNRFKSLIESLIIFAGFIFLQSIILRVLTPSIQSTTQSIKTLLSLYSTTTPALQGNILLTILGFGVIVPFVETRFFFGRLYEIFADKFKAYGGLRDKMNWIIAIFIGAIFAVYHLTARRCGSAATCQNALLFVTFLFGFISTLMVAHYRESKQAVWIHVFANTFSIAYSLGMLGAILGG